MGEPAIEVRGLRKSFGEKEAVAGVDLEIAAGSLAGLVGPNGAGKTTSLSMMTGLRRLKSSMASSSAASTGRIITERPSRSSPGCSSSAGYRAITRLEVTSCQAHR